MAASVSTKLSRSLSPRSVTFAPSPAAATSMGLGGKPPFNCWRLLSTPHSRSIASRRSAALAPSSREILQVLPFHRTPKVRGMETN